MFVDSNNNNCPGSKVFKEYLKVTREELLGVSCGIDGCFDINETF